VKIGLSSGPLDTFLGLSPYMKSLRLTFTAFVAFVLLSSAALAADPSGSWKWSIKFNDQSFDSGGKFALKDGKLSGTLETPMGDVPFTDGTFKDDMVDFALSFDGGGNQIVIKYHGKLEGDTITGKIDFPSFGDGAPAQKLDWKATRVKEEKKPAAPAAAPAPAK
jgi:hypothetical protein